MVDKLVDALANMQEDEALKLTQEYLDHGTDPRQVLEFARQAMDVVGERYAKGEYFLPELVLAGEMLTKVSAIVKPKLVGASPEAKKHGKVLIGTVKGDIHEIGKNVVKLMLEVDGFTVHDLGIDVPLQAFVDKQRETGAEIVAASALLSSTMPLLKDLVELVHQEGLPAAVMVGGAPVKDWLAKEYGADGYAVDAVGAVRATGDLVQRVRAERAAG